jgi:hypothetical protein
MLMNVFRNDYYYFYYYYCCTENGKTLEKKNQELKMKEAETKLKRKNNNNGKTKKVNQSIKRILITSLLFDKHKLQEISNKNRI